TPEVRDQEDSGATNADVELVFTVLALDLGTGIVLRIAQPDLMPVDDSDGMLAFGPEGPLHAAFVDLRGIRLPRVREAVARFRGRLGRGTHVRRGGGRRPARRWTDLRRGFGFGCGLGRRL